MGLINTTTLKLVGYGILVLSVIYLVYTIVHIYKEYKTIPQLNLTIYNLNEDLSQTKIELDTCNENNIKLKQKIDFQNEKIKSLSDSYNVVNEKLKLRTTYSERKLQETQVKLEEAKLDNKSLEETVDTKVDSFIKYYNERIK